VASSKIHKLGKARMIAVASLIISVILPRRTTLHSSSLTFKSGFLLLSLINITQPISAWGRLLLSDGPRQTINDLTLYNIYLAQNDKGAWYDVSKCFAGKSLSTSALTVSTFSNFVFRRLRMPLFSRREIYLLTDY
jgi:hypothetical protein